MGSSFRVVRGSLVASGLALALLRAGAARAGEAETILFDGFESGATCNWSTFVTPTIPGGCIIENACYAPGATDPQNQGCRTCNPALSQTAWQVVNEGGQCSDADACTIGDTCAQGVCQASGTDTCDDGFDCTEDSCDPQSGCLNDPQDSECADLLPCTVNYCGIGEGCQMFIASDSCLIDGTCYADGAPDPGNPCFFCNAGGNNEQFAQRPQGFECAPGSCVDGTQANLPDLCDAKGVCGDFGVEDCPPYVCSGAGCLDSCGSSGDCSNGNYCNVDQCEPKKANGQACAAAEQCSSNFCVDGFCCVSACGGTCEQCVAGTGACNAVTNGTDPAGECPQDAMSTCQRDGFCSGSRTCRLWASGTQCGAPSCTNGTPPFFLESNPPDTCNGSGTCNVTPPFDCGAYLCNTATSLCHTSCTSNSQCDPLFICNGSPGSPGQCIP